MGVQGLWELLAPVGRRVSVDSLGNKKLAVDASIWIIQFMKAMRDENGDMIRNAHLLGFFRRICKLLFLRIKPIFVFDGATPVLKRRTLIARRRQRENAQFKIRKTAEKLLLNHIRSRKLEEIASQISSGERGKTQSQPSSETTEMPRKSIGAGKLERSLEAGAEQGPVSASLDEKSEQESADALLAASIAARYDQNIGEGNDLAEEILEEGDEENEVEELVLPSNVKGLDPAVLASLPASMQLELLVQMREQLVAENRQKFQKVSKVPSSFSQLQIQAYLKTVAFRREITEVQRAAAGGGVEGVPTTRIASTSDREFIFSNSFQGEKPAPSVIEEQRRSQQANSGTIKEVSGSFAGSKLKLFSAITKSQKSSLEKVPEEGVVSLVSTEINEEPDSGTNCSVHTYVDDKGHVRVSRVRGMGVRMTRDLQWNLYLMKDTEARRTLEIGTTSDPPVIPSNHVEDSAVSAAKDKIVSTSRKQGLHISFVDDGNSDYGQDGDLFEELVTVKKNEAHASDPLNSSSPGKNDDHVTVCNNEEEDDFEWEEGVVYKSLDSSEEKEISTVGRQFSGLTHEGQNSGDGMIPRKEEERQRTDHGGCVETVDHAVVEDEDLVEAMKLSLMVEGETGNTLEVREDVILEDEPSSEESEVEWEDGTGDVTVTGFDAVTDETDEFNIQSGPSEEAQMQEAMRRSLEEFHSPAEKISSRLVIKELSDYNPNSVNLNKEAVSFSPLRRAEAASEEIYLASERTRKGKARVGEEETVPHQYESSISGITISEVENRGDTTIIKPAYAEYAVEAIAGENDEKSNNDEKQVGERATESSTFSDAGQSDSEHEHDSVFVSEPAEKSHVEFALGDIENVVSGDFVVGPTHDPNTVSFPLDDKKTPMERETFKDKAPCAVVSRLEAQSIVGKKECTQEAVPGLASQISRKGPDQSSEARLSSDAELLRDAEEIDIEKEREELRLKEEQLLLERKQLAREEEELQAELQAEREEFQAELDRERDLLAREEMELRATQKKNERNAESVTGEMFSDVQELLRMFGLPYVVAPMEAEAQCAYLDATNLVDGVVTEDSDVFLFGGRNVYKNLFDDRKYVETYYVKDLESEMGMNREKLVRMALLLGSDYTEGISGIGIVNAIEVVNAFEEEDGLQKFRMWLDSPDMSLFNKVRERSKVKGNGQVRAKSKSSQGEGEPIEDEVSEGGDLDQTEDDRFTPRQRIFISAHRAVSKNWNIPDSFPSAAVIAAYINPMVDKSKESFSFGRPDLEALRRFCYEKFGWNKDKADELLLPVLKEYDRREIQTRLDSFYDFSQRFAKIRSRRIQKAVTGITGRRSEELMDLPPHLVISSGEIMKKSKTSKTGVNRDTSLLDSEPTSTGYGVMDVIRVGRGRRSRGRGRTQVHSTVGVGEDEENLGNDEDGQSVTNRKSQGKGRVREIAKSSTRSRSRGRGRGRRTDRDADASYSDGGKTDEITQDLMGEVKSLKRKANQLSPVIRRSTRRVSEVNYALDISDEDAGGACSDIEIQTTKLREDSAHVRGRKEMPQEAQGPDSESVTYAASMDLDRPVGSEPSRTDNDLGRGFCWEDGRESGLAEQLQFGKEGSSYLAHGGGFCLDEDEMPPKSLDSIMPGQEQLPSFTSGGGFCLPEDEEETIAKASDIPEENSAHQVWRSEHLKSSKVLNSKSLSSCWLVRDDITPPVKQYEECVEPREMGLRAMPMMRRKNRKSS